MDHRLFAVLAVVCLALEGAGCASESQRESREEILMPLQTGSTLRRSVIMEKKAPAKKSKKKKESTRTAPKPASTPEPEPSPQAEEETAQPDRFR